MGKIQIILFLIVLLGILSCSNSKSKETNPKSKIECIEDTLARNEMKIDYKFSEQNNACYMSVSMKEINTKTFDTFYYDSYDCRMIPKLIYSTNNGIFLRSGTGQYYRELHRYSIENKTIKKSKIQFDIIEPDSLYSFYPFIENDTIKILQLDERLGKGKVFSTNKKQELLNLKSIEIVRRELVVISQDNSEFKINLALFE